MSGSPVTIANGHDSECKNRSHHLRHYQISGERSDSRSESVMITAPKLEITTNSARRLELRF